MWRWACTLLLVLVPALAYSEEQTPAPPVTTAPVTQPASSLTSPPSEPSKAEAIVPNLKAPKLCGYSVFTRAFPVRLAKVLDGDTLDLVVDLGFGILRNVRARLIGIRAPNAYCRSTLSRDRCTLQEKAHKDAVAFVLKWFADHPAAEFRPIDPNGSRAVGYICDRECLNYEMLGAKLAEYACRGGQ